MTDDRIKEIALANGFKLKPQPDGSEDLNPYVFDFARALLVEKQAENDQLWETFVKVADYLDIDYQEARKHPGKPSDVFIQAIHEKNEEIERLEAEVERLTSMIGEP